jgi:hypothetical protein
VLRENTLAEYILLAEGNGGELARSFQAEREPTYAAK